MKQVIFLTFFIINSGMTKGQTLPKTIDLPELGLRFDIPEGWSGQVDGDYILLGHTTIPGLMILSANTAKSIPELEQLAAQGIVDEGVQLSVDGAFTATGSNRLEGFYKGIFNGTAVKCYAIGLINGLGKGMNILILTETDKFTEQHKNEANTLARSVVFSQAQDSQTTTFWKQKIVGKQLYFGLTRSGSSEKRILNLCSDGSYHYYSNIHMSYDEDVVDNNGAVLGNHWAAFNDNDKKIGTYKIGTVGTASILSLTTTDGTTIDVTLSTNEAGNTFLDGSRYYVQNSERCR